MTTKKQPKPFGTWPSLISPGDPGRLRDLSEPQWTASGDILWLEQVGDQSSLMIQERGKPPRTLDPDRSLGGGILYGGGTYSTRGNQVMAVEARSARLICIPLPSGVARLICELPGRAACPQLSPDGDLCLFVHSAEDRDGIVSAWMDPKEQPRPLISGADFYNYPRWHPGGSQVAWVSWDHPHLPWEESTLYLADLARESGGIALKGQKILAGGPGTSVAQPEFSPDGSRLAYLSDHSGWWQLFLLDLPSGETRQLTSQAADHGQPAWLQNISTYSFTPDGRAIFILRNQQGFASLWRIDLETGRQSRIQHPPEYTWLKGLAVSPQGDRLLTVASSGTKPQHLVTLDLEGAAETIRPSAPPGRTIQGSSPPQAVAWKGFDGKQVHGLMYFPDHPGFTDRGQPPLLVIAHSGPTRQVWADFHPRTQHFTSRGFAVLEVNYRGSTGFGREYWEALKGRWGVLDVADVLSGAGFAVEQGWADPSRMALFGSSAGGYTVLQTLVHHPGVFCAGISLYGIANQITLLQDPPKFERFYSEWLLGPYPQKEDLYRERSPLYHADQIRDPVAIFQGGKDPIVPPDQAEQIVAALRQNQVPHEYHFYPEESHGFKLPETKQDVTRKIDAFLETYLLESR